MGFEISTLGFGVLGAAFVIALATFFGILKALKLADNV